MAGFTENALIRKLQELNSSQQSIQTLSLWLIHHRKHHNAVVKTWFKELLKVKDGRQLTFMYLANDVIQNSKKKGPEYGQEFGKVLMESFKHMAKTGINTKTKHSLHRILNIWQERGVYDAVKIQEFKVAVDPNDAEPEIKTATKRKSIDSVTPEPEEPKKKPKTEREPKHESRRSETRVEVDGQIETRTTLSPRTPPGDPPEPEELVRAVLELESSASSDEVVRERIASLPPEVSEVSLLNKLQGNTPVVYDLEMYQRLRLEQTIISVLLNHLLHYPVLIPTTPIDFYDSVHPIESNGLTEGNQNNDQVSANDYNISEPTVSSTTSDIDMPIQAHDQVEGYEESLN